jgi:hypothetical protein
MWNDQFSVVGNRSAIAQALLLFRSHSIALSVDTILGSHCGKLMFTKRQTYPLSHTENGQDMLPLWTRYSSSDTGRGCPAFTQDN